MSTHPLAVQALMSDAQSINHDANPQAMAFSIDYLTVFGYLAKYAIENVKPADVVAAVKKFQQWFGLAEDGIVGPKTLRAMQVPRCGCPDIVRADNPDHQKYVQFMEAAEQNMNSWRKRGLSYFIKSYVSGPTQTQQENAIAAAWAAWDKVCGISINRTGNPQQADIIIDTGSGPASNFDGPSGTLAWAYLPQGDDQQLLMRFDLSETWIVDPSQRGILMVNVACHEFGHLLGLTHSNVQGSLMAPYYNAQIGVPQWNDDIPRVQARYGPDTAPAPTPTPPPTPVPTPTPGSGTDDVYIIRCKNLKVDGYTLFASGGK